jgi:hypothetical protein
VGEHSDGIERVDPYQTSESPTAVIKRKTSDLDHLFPELKRVCMEQVFTDLDALSSVDDSDARETSTPKTNENKDRLGIATLQPTAGGLAALVVSTDSAELQVISSSDIGATLSISLCGSSIGSLFGRPSTHAHQPWKTWPSTSPSPDSVRSLHSIGMAAPMLEEADEELLLSRTANDPEELCYQYRWTIEAFLRGHSSDLDPDYQDSHAPRGVRCLFGFLGCSRIFTDLVRWSKHCKGHFRERGPPKELRCPYSSCAWTTSKLNGEDAWTGRLNHIYWKHDFLSQSEKLHRKPDAPTIKHLWYVKAISDAQLLELRMTGRLSQSTPFDIPQRPDRNRFRRQATRR